MLVNTTAFLIILTADWYPHPEYEDEERQAQTTTLFVCLLVQRLAFAGIKYVTLYISSIFEQWSPVLIFFKLILMCSILKDWVFYIDANKQVTMRIEKGDEV